MTAKTKFKSPAFEAIHSAAAGLSSVDAISAETMRTFDKACLTSVQDLQPVEIKSTAGKIKSESARLRSLSQYQRFNCTKMGKWR